MSVKEKTKEFLKFGKIPIILASLCCLTPAVLVSLGISTVAFATDLANVQYKQYAWVFRIIGFLALLVSVISYLRREKGICTLDEAVKRKTEVINIIALAIIGGIIGYAVFLYGIVEIWGLLLGIW